MVLGSPSRTLGTSFCPGFKKASGGCKADATPWPHWGLRSAGLVPRRTRPIGWTGDLEVYTHINEIKLTYEPGYLISQPRKYEGHKTT